MYMYVNVYVCRCICTLFRFFYLNNHLKILVQRRAISLNLRNNQALPSSKDGQIADKTLQD